MTVCGWTGKILRIDLTRGKIWVTPNDYVKSFIGGRGVNAKILYDEIGPHVEPYDPENRLIFGTMPLTGTTSPASGKTFSTTKSPMTGLYGAGGLGGFWGPELKFAGYDHLVVMGRSEKPVYIYIFNEKVEIRSAENIWGKDTFETQELLRKEVGDPEVKSICIGPAGENLVRFASIRHLLKNTIGRPGQGAVMGSKRLKAVAVRGTGDIEIARPKEFLELCKKVHEEIRNRPDTQLHLRNSPEVGCGNLPDKAMATESCAVGILKSLDWKDYRQGAVVDFLKEHGKKLIGCYGCPVSCFNLVSIPGLGIAQIGCAMTLDFTSKIMNPDPKFMVKCCVLCNELGMDTISTAGTIACAMEMYERGIIAKKDTDGLDLTWGNKEAIIRLIEKMARREGIGDDLAEGSFRFTKKFGQYAKQCSLNVRGLEDYPHDPRPFPALALTMAMNARGDSVQGWAICERLNVPLVHANEFFSRMEPDFPGFGGSMKGIQEYSKAAMKYYEDLFGTDKATHHEEYEGKAIAQIHYDNDIVARDMVGTCKFLGAWWGWPYLIPQKTYVALLAAATGVEYNTEEICKASDRVITLERSFNVREGLTGRDDMVSDRYFQVPVQEGMHRGEVLDRAKYKRMKEEYYKLRGWNMDGIPRKEKLEELGLEYVVRDFQQSGIC